MIFKDDMCMIILFMLFLTSIYGELYHYIMLFYMAPMILHSTRFTALTLSIFICYILLLFYHRILHYIVLY